MTGIWLHSATRVEALADDLAARLSVPGPDPFATDLVCVPHASVQRWLSQHLGRRLGPPGEGICAGIEFLTFRRLLRRLAPTAAPDPWQPRRLVWTLLTVVADNAADPELAQLNRHLGASRDSYTVLRRIAALFARYAEWRPELLTAWQSGRDCDAAGQPLGFDSWQPRLWRLAVEQLGGGPLEAQNALLEAVHSGASTGLPDGLSFFLPDAPSPRRVGLLEALAERHRVDLYLPGSASPPSTPSGTLLAQRLGRQAANDRGVFAASARSAATLPESSDRPDSVLGRLQASLAGAPVQTLSGTPDTSLQVHACHGLDRQIEVVRDVVTALLADDPTLEPRDVVIGCADLGSASPLISATFGLPATVRERHPANDFRVQLADRNAAQLNPVVGVLLRILGLVSGRAEASELLDLCAQPSVAARFGIVGDDPERLAALVEQSGIRWGLSAAHRARFGLGQFRQNTWVAGLRRMQLGIALSEDALPTVGTTLPLDDVDSSDVNLIGGVSELVSRLSRLATEFEAPATLGDWLERLHRALDWLTLLTGEDSWQRTHAWVGLAAVGERAGRTGLLSLADITRIVTEEFTESAARPVFGNGSLTVCGIDSLHGLPHRVICLVGLDDGVFPRVGELDGDDLLRRDPEPGDPDPAASDRQILLDSIMAARQSLVITYQGRDPVTNELVQPPGALSDLLDALHIPVTVEHSLQPFSSRYFTGELRSFDTAALRGAIALGDPRPNGRTDATLPPAPPLTEIGLDELIRFSANPARFFLRRRCGLAMGDSRRDLDEIPVELDGLGRWAVGGRMLRLARQGHDLGQIQSAEWLRGQVPPGKLGERLLTTLGGEIDGVLAALPSEAANPAVAHDLVHDVDGVRISGRVLTNGDSVLTVDYSSLQAKHWLAAWLRLLLLAAAAEGEDNRWRARIVTRNRRGGLRMPDPALASVLLRDWVRLVRIGLNRPLPMPPRVAQQIADLRGRGGDPFDPRSNPLRRLFEWDTANDASWQEFYPTLDALLALPAGTDGVPALGEATLAGSLARLVWDPLREHRES